MKQRLVVQPQYCIGCRACEMACAFTHGHAVSGGSGAPQPGKSRCKTLTVGKDAYVPLLCLQCDYAACMQVCPVQAITRDADTGVILVNYEKCMQCMACTVACPFGNMHIDPANGSVAKCDLCAGYGDNPRCALFCPTKCLTVEQLA